VVDGDVDLDAGGPVPLGGAPGARASATVRGAGVVHLEQALLREAVELEGGQPAGDAYLVGDLGPGHRATRPLRGQVHLLAGGLAEGTQQPGQGTGAPAHPPAHASLDRAMAISKTNGYGEKMSEWVGWELGRVPAPPPPA
jgi:hypothetical protein